MVALSVAALLVATTSWAKGPPVTRRTLSNGVQLQVSEQHGVPAVVVEILVDAGSRLDPPGKEGLAGMTADLLTEGAGTRNSQEISDLVDFMGASLSSSAREDNASVHLTTLTRTLDQGLDLASDILLRPTFPDEEIERSRESTLAAIKASEDSPGTLAGRAFDQALFGSGPYGHPVEGTTESVQGINAGDIRDFYSRWYRPERTIIAVVGDIDTAAAIAAFEARLGGWKPGLPAEATPAPIAPGRATTIVIDKPLTQANIILGHGGVARDNPDYYALTILNHILGGSAFSSRLFDDIRTRSGLAYSVASYFTANKLPGSFQVMMQTKSESAQDAIGKARVEIERIRREPVSKTELDEAKRYLTGSFPLRLTSNSKVAAFLTQVTYFGLGDDYADRYPEHINAVTAADVQRVAQKYLHPDDLILVVVGDPAQTGITASPAAGGNP